MDEYNLNKNQRRKNLGNKAKRYAPDGRKPANPKNKHLIEVYQDTIRVTKELKLKPDLSTLYKITDLSDPDPVEILQPCDIQVLCVDTLDMAQEFARNGPKPLILNLASDYKPGGGVASGKTAQEECLFRRTNAFMTHPPDWYPLDPTSVIYSPQVTVLKDSSHTPLPQPFEISMISVPAIRKPRLLNNLTTYQDEDRLLMTQKIEAIFKIAILNGHRTLVLGALGCGAFKNPPQAVAQIFKSLLAVYSRYFTRIGFAILPNHGDMTNHDVFQKLLAN